ncbi:hypothetical protein EGR_03509 [Echinococcus granulosus]|uniref:Uncharacterized protein n=1 Tax=Echinococcus granulosus TaxID=6210 RepID=W6UJJ7_ECHGR|nr:hypothetical protein EGR_03509 [Echinococcus granulosus]EUB61695.1 hypothetical protein EGR_03509 [Echinococcus granulosus]
MEYLNQILTSYLKRKFLLHKKEFGSSQEGTIPLFLSSSILFPKCQLESFKRLVNQHLHAAVGINFCIQAKLLVTHLNKLFKVRVWVQFNFQCHEGLLSCQLERNKKKFIKLGYRTERIVNNVDNSTVDDVSLPLSNSPSLANSHVAVMEIAPQSEVQIALLRPPIQSSTTCDFFLDYSLLASS